MNNKFDLIEANDFGRRLTVRYKQYEYDKPLEHTNWIIKKNGCAVCSLATILATFGFKEDPIFVAKNMLFNEFGFLSNGYFDGINGVSVLYCLNKLISQEVNIEYKIIKINYEHLEFMKQVVIDMIKEGYMAMVGVGPHSNIFADGGHYIVITSVNNKNDEFYICNSWYDGDNQINETFSYEDIVKNIYKDNFDFLMIRKKD